MKLMSPCCPKSIVECCAYLPEYDADKKQFVTSHNDDVFYTCKSCGNDSLELSDIKKFNNLISETDEQQTN